MKRPLAITVIALVLLAGCGSGKRTTPTVTSHATTAADSTQASPAVLQNAVRRAIEDDHRMSVRVLWTNDVPRHPTATAGPALANLRSSAAERRRRHVRVRLLSERFRILRIDLDPSYASATATVLDVQRVQRSHGNGKPRGKPVRLVERAHLVLRRSGTEPRFMVWKVTVAR
jgi:hypothetical protein